MRKFNKQWIRAIIDKNNRFGILVSLLLVFVVVFSGCTTQTLGQDVITNNVSPANDSVYDVGTIISQYHNGYFNNLYVNGSPVLTGLDDVFNNIYVDNVLTNGGPGYIGNNSSPFEDGYFNTLYVGGALINTSGVHGLAGTMVINSTTTGLPGTNASVVNVGNTTDAKLDFTIPAGANGSDGLAATITVNSTATGAPNTSASVTNIGNSSNAILDFTIPQGAKGDKGDQGVPGTNGSSLINESTTTTLIGFLKGNGSYVYADNSTYLKTDASNGPVTGDLAFNGNISAAMSNTYAISDACFDYGGNSYVAGAGTVGFDGALWCDGTSIVPMIYPGVDYSTINGTNNIQCGLYTLMIDHSPIYVYLTVYYLAGEESLIGSMFDGFVGSGNWSVIVGSDIFVPTAGIYSFTGYPSGWTLSDTYPDPVVNAIQSYNTQLLSNGDVNVGGNLTTKGEVYTGSGNITTYNGKLKIGVDPITHMSPFDPMVADYAVAVVGSSQVSNPSSQVAGLIFLYQHSSNGNGPGLIYGIDGACALYGSANYGGAYGVMGNLRLDIDGHTISAVYGMESMITFAGGDHSGSPTEGISNVNNLIGFKFDDNIQSSPGDNITSSVVQNYYGLYDGALTSAHPIINNFYGIYMRNHSTAATNSWGIWNEDRTYLGGNVNLNGELSGSGRISLAKTVTDYNESQSEGSANAINLNYAPSTSNYTDDYAALAVGTAINTTNADVGNTIGLDVGLTAVDGSKNINEFKTIRTVPNVGPDFTGTIDKMIGIKSIAAVDPAAIPNSTVNNLWLFWAGTSFGSYANIQESTGLHVDDLDPSGVMGSHPTYGVYVANQSATNSYGIYVANSSNYFGSLKILGDGELQPATVSDAAAANNSIYLSGDTGNLSYKDSGGDVHMFAWQ